MDLFGKLVPASHDARVLLVATLSMVALLANFLAHYSRGSFVYDEGDYYVASYNGMWNNWFDADDIPITTFVGTGWRAVRGEVEKGEISRMIRASGSTAFRRHYHPPFAFYAPVVTRTLFPDADPEHQLRSGNFILLILFIGILSLLGLRYPDTFTPWMILIPASANWVVSSGGFNMHVPFGLAVAAMLICWGGYERDRRRVGLRRGALAALAIACTSVEYSLFLLGMLALWTLLDLWRRRSEWKGVVAARAKDLLWFLGFLAVIWPAGILKLGLLKSYALQTYIALFRLKSVESGFDSVWDMLAGKFSPSPLELLLLLAGLIALVALRRRILGSGSLFVMTGLIAAIMITQSAPNLVLPWYLMPVYSLVFAVVYHRFWLDRGWGSRTESGTALSLAIVVFAVAQLSVHVEPYLQSRHVKQAVERLPSLDIVTVLGLAPPMAAYFPERDVVGYHAEDLDRGDFRDSIERWGADRLLILRVDGKWQPSASVALPYDTIQDVILFHPVGTVPGPPRELEEECSKGERRAWDSESNRSSVQAEISRRRSDSLSRGLTGGIGFRRSSALPEVARPIRWPGQSRSSIVPR